MTLDETIQIQVTYGKESAIKYRNNVYHRKYDEKYCPQCGEQILPTIKRNSKNTGTVPISNYDFKKARFCSIRCARIGQTRIPRPEPEFKTVGGWQLL